MFNPLKIVIKRSSFWYLWLVGVHALAMLSLFLTPLPTFTKVILLVGLCLSYWSFFKFPINKGIAGLIWNQDRSLFATVNEAGLQTFHEMPRRLLRLPFLVCIYVNAKAPVPNQWIILLPDMMSKAEWRRLQVMARWSELQV
ncbi:MAG TPA: protein YgfX [Marinobacterium sp.]|nr:protein YgfX [Marinobacterium sp.]